VEQKSDKSLLVPEWRALVIAPASGSQLAFYARGAGNKQKNLKNRMRRKG
jgi:hypothetical protein